MRSATVFFRWPMKLRQVWRPARVSSLAFVDTPCVIHERFFSRVCETAQNPAGCPGKGDA